MHGSVAVFLVLLGEDNGFFSLVLLKKEGDEVGQGDEVVQGCLGVRWQWKDKEGESGSCDAWLGKGLDFSWKVTVWTSP